MGVKCGTDECLFRRLGDLEMEWGQGVYRNVGGCLYKRGDDDGRVLYKWPWVWCKGRCVV